MQNKATIIHDSERGVIVVRCIEDGCEWTHEVPSIIPKGQSVMMVEKALLDEMKDLVELRAKASYQQWVAHMQHAHGKELT